MRWFLLQEVEFRPRQADSGRLQICNNKRRHQITLKRQRQPYRTTEGSRGGVGLRQYRVVRWFLLPEGELRQQQGQVGAADCKSAETDNETGGSRLQIWQNKIAIWLNGQQTKPRRRRAISSTSRLFSPARDAYGRRRQKAAELQIRLTDHG